MTTIPEVFIIESLRFEDEKNRLFEGKIVSDILNMAGHRSQYYYIRTKNEFFSVVRLFGQSGYRFLHLSCRGGEDAMFTTLDTIFFDELSAILAPVMTQKRLFVSTPSLAGPQFAHFLWPHCRCYSLVGPTKTIHRADAPIFWSGFYHLMPSYNWQTMRQQGLVRYLNPISILYDTPLNYYFVNSKEKAGFRHSLIPTGK